MVIDTDRGRPGGVAEVGHQPPPTEELHPRVVRRGVRTQGHHQTGADAVAHAEDDRRRGQDPERVGERQQDHADAEDTMLGTATHIRPYRSMTPPAG